MPTMHPFPSKCFFLSFLFLDELTQRLAVRWKRGETSHLVQQSLQESAILRSRSVQGEILQDSTHIFPKLRRHSHVQEAQLPRRPISSTL